jgi:Uma2 family endonuclease
MATVTTRGKTIVPTRPAAVVADAWPAICIPRSAVTLAGFRAWANSDQFPERGRISFIDREILIEMSPEEASTHNKLKNAITSRLEPLCFALKLGDYFSDGMSLVNEKADVLNEPDGMVVRWDSIRAGRARLVPRKDRPGEFVEVEGTPDIVIEIISLSSVVKDTQKLMKTYHRAGIPEYWLIDAMGEQVSFEIFQYQQDAYVATSGRGGWRRSEVLGRSFRIQRQRNPIGLWHYFLRVKAG